MASIIYKITSASLPNVIYIGSTSVKMALRFKRHKSQYKLFVNGLRKSTCSSYRLLRYDDVKITKLEYCDEDVQKLRETIYIAVAKLMFTCLNRYYAVKTKTKSLYYKQNKDYILTKSKVYRDANKEAITKRVKQYYNENQHALKEKSKIWNKNNKDQKRETGIAYRAKNKEKIAASKKEKVQCCNCSVYVTRSNLSKHKKSKRCQLIKKQ